MIKVLKYDYDYGTGSVSRRKIRDAITSIHNKQRAFHQFVKIGNLVSVHRIISDAPGTKRRTQVFTGIVTGVGGTGESPAFIVSKATTSGSIERQFVLKDHTLLKIEAKPALRGMNSR